jgi:hypothetical protein
VRWQFEHFVTQARSQYSRKSTSTEVKTAMGLPFLIAGLNFHCFHSVDGILIEALV